jgi:hypothetical protein
MPRAPRQGATHNIDMAIEPEEGGKLAHERLQSALPVRAKTRRQTITPDGTPGPLCQGDSDRRQTAAIFLHGRRTYERADILQPKNAPTRPIINASLHRSMPKVSIYLQVRREKRAARR